LVSGDNRDYDPLASIEQFRRFREMLDRL